MKKIISIVLCFVLVLCCLCACGGGETPEEGKTLNIGVQVGIGYAPAYILQAEKFIDKYYGSEVKVEITQLDSGASVNEGLMAGTFDIGCMGLAPAISAVVAGVGNSKIISNLNCQAHGLMTNKDEIKTLADIKPEDKIALVKEGSFQHILLAMAAEKELGDAHALDNNIQAMSHVEGMAALESGTVALHLTTSQYIAMERENKKYHEIDVVKEIWPDDNSFLVAIAPEKLQKDDPKLFEAVQKGFADSIDFINNNLDEAAKIIGEKLSMTTDEAKENLSDGTTIFQSELKGVMQMAEFMYRAKFIETEVKSIDDLKYSSTAVK